MAIMVKKKKSDYTPAPEGLHQAVCCDVLESWTEESKFKAGRLEDKTRIFWQLDILRTWEFEGQEFTAPYEVSNTYTMSLHEKSNMCRALEAWRGKRFTDKEKEGFDLESLLGANCQIQVVHNIKDSGEVYANVGAIVPIGKNMQKISVSEGYVRRGDRDPKPGHESPAVAQEASSDSDTPF